MGDSRGGESSDWHSREGGGRGEDSRGGGGRCGASRGGGGSAVVGPLEKAEAETLKSS